MSGGTYNGALVANVALNGNSTTTVPARYSVAYTPNAGDQVLMMNLGSDSRLRQQWVVLYVLATGTPPPVTSKLVQGQTAFVDSALWGTVPAAGTLLYSDVGAANVVTSSSGSWSLTLGYTYTTGYAALAVSGASGDCAFTPINQGLCNGTTLSGRANTSTGAAVDSTLVVVSYFVLGT